MQGKQGLLLPFGLVSVYFLLSLLSLPSLSCYSLSLPLSLTAALSLAFSFQSPAAYPELIHKGWPLPPCLLLHMGAAWVP